MLDMPEALISTRFKARGPWLIDSTQLQQLEVVVDPFARKRPSQAAAPSDAARSEDCDRSLTILLSGGRELPVESFKQAFIHPTSQHEIPAGFNYRIRLGNIQAVVRISPDTAKEQAGSKTDDEELEIRVTPRSSRVSQELFVALKDWVEDVEPSAYQRWLLIVRPLARLFLFFMLLVGGFAFFSPATDSKQLYKEEGHKILKDGVNQSNQQRAIEILLALQTDYNPPVKRQEKFGAVSPTFVVAVFILAVLAVTPRISLGFWKGKSKLRLHRWWMKAVPGAIPGLIVARYVLPQILSFAERAFRH